MVSVHAEAREPLFVCVRHGSNTWAWGAAASHFDDEVHAVRVAATALHGADRAFAAKMRSDGVVPGQLAARRAAAPAVNKHPAAGTDTTFFDFLYGGATSSAERAAWTCRRILATVASISLTTSRLR